MHAYYEFNVMYNVIRQAIKVTPNPTQTGYEAVTVYFFTSTVAGCLTHSPYTTDATRNTATSTCVQCTETANH